MTSAVDLSPIPDVQSVLSRITQIQQLISTASSGTSAAAFASAMGATTSTTSTDTGSTSATTDSGSVTGSQVVSDAEQYLGVPYVWGGESTSGLDCSGLVQKTFSDLGVSLPRTAAEQQKCGTPVASLSQAQPGDLLFFGQPAYHVAIYAGNNQLIESPEPGKTVHLTTIYQTPTSISRIVGTSAAGSTSSTSSSGGLSATALQAAGIKSSVAAYASQFAAAEQANGLPSGMLAAVCQQESGGNANAVSSCGAQGLMQIMPSTAAGMGINAYNPSQAIQAAGKILGNNLREFGSVSLALAAYNAGGGAVRQYAGIPPYSQTQNYVRNITAMMAAGG